MPALPGNMNLSISRHLNHSNRPSTLGILGFGSFGQFMAKTLSPYFSISVWDLADRSQTAHSLGLQWGTREEVLAQELVCLAVPVQFLEAVLTEVRHRFIPGTLVFDVSSVKVKPVELMTAFLPPEVEIIATHPLFGPESGKNGIQGLQIACCPVRSSRFACFTEFLSTRLGLRVIETTPAAHDQAMAYVQALTHLVGKTLHALKIPELELETVAYRHLLEIEKLLGNDSEALFQTIQRENPFAEAIRQDFLKTLTEISYGIDCPQGVSSTDNPRRE